MHKFVFGMAAVALASCASPRGDLAGQSPPSVDKAAAAPALRAAPAGKASGIFTRNAT